MKSILLCCSLLILGASVCSAQEIGARWGDVTGGDWAVDMVLGTAQFNRIHADISFGNGVGVDLLWDCSIARSGKKPSFTTPGLGRMPTLKTRSFSVWLENLGLSIASKMSPSWSAGTGGLPSDSPRMWILVRVASD